MVLKRQLERDLEIRKSVLSKSCIRTRIMVLRGHNYACVDLDMKLHAYLCGLKF